MPLTSKGEKIKEAMEEEYGKSKGESVFYASKNAGKITGVDARPTLLKATPDQMAGVNKLIEGGISKPPKE